jgi:HTH-type transcriptional regulator/antitoxin HigA
MRMEMIVIENDADLAEAMAIVDALMVSRDQPARLRAQARLIEDYEKRCWSRKAPSVPDLLLYLMEQHDLTRADMAPLLGGAGRVSEALNGKAQLSMTQVRRLRSRFGIPADLLIPGADRRAVA